MTCRAGSHDYREMDTNHPWTVYKCRHCGITATEEE